MDGMRQFELIDNLEAYGTARAVLMKFNGSTYVRSAEQITVQDFIGSHGDRGDRGYTFFSTESNRWEVAAGLFQHAPANRW